MCRDYLSFKSIFVSILQHWLIEILFIMSLHENTRKCGCLGVCTLRSPFLENFSTYLLAESYCTQRRQKKSPRYATTNFTTHKLTHTHTPHTHTLFCLAVVRTLVCICVRVCFLRLIEISTPASKYIA